MVRHGDEDSWGEDSRKRFTEDYAYELLKITRRQADGRRAQTPQDAANELIDIAVEALANPGCVLPEPIRDYLHQALCDIQDGKGADVALGIKVPAGRRPLDDSFVTAIVAVYTLEIRHGLAPADAKRAVLKQVEAFYDGGRTMDWISDLLTKHPDVLDGAKLLSEDELAAVAVFDAPPQLGIK